MKILFPLLLCFCSTAFAQNFSISRSELDGKHGVKNEKGEIVVPEQYAAVFPLAEGNFVVYEEDPGWPMIINYKNEILVSKTNYIGRALDAYNNYFLCQYYKNGAMADFVLFKAPDTIVYTFPIHYVHVEFVKDSCYTYVSAQTVRPGERLAVNLKGNALTGPSNTDFDYIKGLFKPCNSYAIVMKDKGYDGFSTGVYDLNNSKMIIPCKFYNIEYDAESGLIKAYDKVYSSTYDLYNIQGDLVKTWKEIKE